MLHEQKTLLEKFAAPLIGLSVAHVWRSDGSTIFLEFGVLTPSRRVRRDGSLGNPYGEMALSIYGSWRIEGKRLILCGSSTDNRGWSRAARLLKGSIVVDFNIYGRLPEVGFSLSTGVHVVSFTARRGNPDWVLFDRTSHNHSCLFVRNSQLSEGPSSHVATLRNL